MFQSTPAITDGRRTVCIPDAANVIEFQSTPAITDGRRCFIVGGAGAVIRFNPRPPSLTGDAAGPEGLAQGQPVSIHARHH